MSDGSQVRNTRIVYVEPNDAYRASTTTSDGIKINKTLTPPLEDMCISFNLTAYVFSRTKPKVSASKEFFDTNNIRQWFNLEWKTKEVNDLEKEGKGKPFSFLSGVNYGTDDNPKEYLTTYYTDISYENYGTNKIVEGLGVESIQVSFESWYTPTVTIKFVDVRGSAIFGNEEAIHDKQGNLTADNVFGCFMTIPYPLFRLQIKGFLGKPVTYQLTCSDCKFDYNPRTGNVEATVQFIGYTYSLLTDIPIKYIVAAPYMTYVGQDYWDAHKSSADWALDNGSQPPKLFDFFQEIEAALNMNATPSEEVSDEANQVARYNTEKTALRDLLKAQQEFVTAYLKLFSGYYDNANDEGYRQIVCFRKNKLEAGVDDTTFEDMQEKYRSFKTLHDSYNADYASTALSNDLLPDMGLGKDKCDYPNADNHHAFTIEYKDGMVRTDVKFFKLTNSGKTVNLQNIQDYTWGKSQKLIKENAQKLLKSGLTNPFDSVVEEYCYILDLNVYTNKIQSRIDELNIKTHNTQRRIDNQAEAQFLTKIGFRPDIGNVFKILMCHLETFVHVMYHAAGDIIDQANRGERSFAKLGLQGAQNTDYKDGVTKVGPWPGVYKHDTSNNSSVSSNDSDRTLAWVGDFSNDFIEIDVVEGIFGAVLRLMEEKYNNTGSEPDSNLYPFLPTDLEMSSPFVDVRIENTIDNMAAQLAQRGATLFGLLNGSNISDEMAAMMGRADAYNYFLAFGSAIAIEQDILNRVGQNNLADVLVGIAMCDSTYNSFGSLNQNTGETHFCFEVDNPVAYGGMEREKRQPLLRAEGNKFKYVYYGLKQRDGNETIGAISSYVRSNYRTDRAIEFNEDHHEIVYKSQSHTIEPKSCVHAGNSKKALKTVSALSKPDDYIEKYVNRAMFNIITDDSKIARLEAIDKTARSGSLHVGTYDVSEDFSALADRYWKVRDKDVSHFFAKKSGYGYYYLSETIPNRFTAAENVPEYNPEPAKRATLNDEGAWTVTDNENKPLSVPATVVVSPNNESFLVSLFTHSFYYLQNEITDEATRKKVKMLLFLHAQWWSKDVMECFKSSNGCMEAVPYGYLLLLGGLLWRKRQSADPIKYSASGHSWKTNTKDKTFFYKNDDNELAPRFLHNSTSTNYNITVLSLLGGEYYPDINIQNQLIRLFEDFVDTNFTLISGYELQHNNGGKFKSCTATEINKDIIEYRKYRNEVKALDSYKEKSVASGAEYIKAHLNGNLPEIWSKYGYSGYSPDVVNGTTPTGDRPVILYYKSDDSAIQGLYDKLLSKCVVANVTHQPLFENGAGKDITFSASTYRRYVSSFVETLKKVVENNQNSILQSDGKSSQGEGKDLREFRMGIYYYCKALWENWLVGENESSFDVNPFFKDNFIFIDSFYRNIYSQLPMNCEHLVTIYNGSSDTTSLFSYMSNLISKQRCIFFAVPDYIGFQGDDADYERMADVFRPIPYQEMKKELETSNKFVIIYTHKPSEHLYTEANEFRWDGFDIWAADGKSGEVENNPPMIFKSDTLNPNPTGDYHVPSFGVAVNRQENTIFKNISLTNRNPVQTEAAMVALSNILDRAKNRSGAVTFHGQDMYNVFSSYSYQAEIEMMGDAQIQPLMYFQLLNVPMWRGTYMIFNVQHNMTPGNMSTKFKGMKLCATPIPFAASYLTFLTPSDRDGYGISQGRGGYSGGVISLDSDYPKVDLNSAKDHFHDYPTYRPGVPLAMDDNKTTGLPVNQTLRKLFNAIVDEVEALGEGWTLHLISTGRGAGDLGNHSQGDAIDICVTRDNGKTRIPRLGYQPELLKVVDIIACNHLDVAGRVAIECGLPRQVLGKTGEALYKFDMLHLETNIAHSNSTKGGRQASTQFPMWEWKNGAGSTYTSNKTKGADFIKMAPPEFHAIAHRFYLKGGAQEVIKRFPNYGNNQTIIDEFFNEFNTDSEVSGSATFERWWNWTVSFEGKVKGDNKDYCGITPSARRSYEKYKGLASGAANSLSAKTVGKGAFWDQFNLDKIKDPNVAILCGWCVYWGNTTVIKRGLNGERNVADDVLPWFIGRQGKKGACYSTLTPQDIDAINNTSNQKELFNHIKYLLGRAISTVVVNETWNGQKLSGPAGKVYSGYNRRWRSLEYNNIRNADSVSQSEAKMISAEELNKLWS